MKSRFWLFFSRGTMPDVFITSSHNCRFVCVEALALLGKVWCRSSSSRFRSENNAAGSSGTHSLPIISLPSVAARNWTNSFASFRNVFDLTNSPRASYSWGYR